MYNEENLKTCSVCQVRCQFGLELFQLLRFILKVASCCNKFFLLFPIFSSKHNIHSLEKNPKKQKKKSKKIDTNERSIYNNHPQPKSRLLNKSLPESPLLILCFSFRGGGRRQLAPRTLTTCCSY